MNQMKIKKIATTFYTQLAIAGLKGLQTSHKDLEVKELRTGEIKEAMNKIAQIYVGFFDTKYYTTSKENWDKMLDIIDNIIKEFPWIREKFDCDNRARLVGSLCSLFFGVNTCGYAWVFTRHINTGKRSSHYANIIALDNGSLILYDVDNKRRRLVLSNGKPITAGYKSYEFQKAYFG